MILVVDNYDAFTYNLVQYLGERGAEFTEVGALLEPGEHALHLLEQCAIVGIGAQEDQQLVELRDRARRGQSRPFEAVEQGPLALRPAAPPARDTATCSRS